MDVSSFLMLTFWFSLTLLQSDFLKIMISSRKKRDKSCAIVNRNKTNTYYECLKSVHAILAEYQLEYGDFKGENSLVCAPKGML